VLNFLRSIIAKLAKCFKRKPKITKYSMSSVGDEALMRITVDDGPYEGVVYAYGRVAFEEPDNSIQPLKINFNYDILQYPKNVNLDGFDSIAFEILSDLLTNPRSNGLEPNRRTNPDFIVEE
jgi:hypothetical protein